MKSALAYIANPALVAVVPYLWLDVLKHHQDKLTQSKQVNNG
ncbi:MAG TPA: hypothetical protein VGD04_02020 [Methylophilus sp.]